MNAITVSPYRSLFGDMNHLMDNLFMPAREQVNSQSLLPRMDIVETEQGFEIHADLPGVKKEDINISVKDNVLTINAESVVESKEESKTLIQRERRVGKYSRSLKLGKSVDESAIKADYENGVLTLSLPKAAEAEVKKIPVNVN